MRCIDKTLIAMLEEHRMYYTLTAIDETARSKADKFAFAVLLVSSRFNELVSAKQKILARLDASIETIWNSDKPHSYKQADALTLQAAGAFVGVGKKKREQFVKTCLELLCHRQSGLRYHCYEVVWLARKQLPVSDVADCLLRNVADTLGFVVEAAIVARALFSSDEQFFGYAEQFEAPDGFADKYEDRLGRRQLAFRFSDN